MTTSITGQGITAYKVPDDALSNESKNAVQNKVVNSSVYFINKELEAYKRFLNDGAYTITADDLESGQWSYSRKDVNTARARTKALIPVRAGTIITYENTTFDIYFGVLLTVSDMGYVEMPGWKTDGSGTINITKNGYLTFVIRNHADNTAAVNPADFDSVVTIRTSAQSNLLNTISQLEEKVDDIYDDYSAALVALGVI